MSKVSIETAFGTLDNDQLTSLRSGVKEISVHLSRIDGEKEQVKDIVNNLFDELYTKITLFNNTNTGEEVAFLNELKNK